MNAAPKRIEIKELPEGWIEINLNAAVESMKNGLYKPANEYAEHGIACLRMYNIDGGRIIWKNIKRMLLTSEEVNEYQLTPDDLLVNRVNSRELVGKTAVFPKGLEPCVYESKNIRVRLLSELVNSDFVNYQLLLFGQHHFNYNSQQVVGMASISQPQIGDFPLLLPPRFEQDRIVSKVQAMLAKLAKSSSHIANVAKTLKRFRQAVLAAACSGRLTEDWRDKQRETEASELLLDSLLKQRREEWSRLQLLRLRARGKKVKPETLNDKYVEPQPLPHPPEAELPEGWIWVSLEQLAFVMSGNTPTGIEKPTGTKWGRAMVQGR
jgi:type I restriction enzyme S subunit